LISARRRVLVAVVTTVASLAMLAMASSASASPHNPKGAFAPFADCPLNNPEINACIVAKTEGGEFTIGKDNVPIVNTITLQGGLSHLLTGEEKFFGAEDGNTLSHTPQKVPGGLLGLVKCNEISNFIERIACEVVFENGLTGVNETTELAAPATSIGLNTIALVGQSGTALSLPVKVHLENPLLGSSCYLGSNSAPIVINFTSGTTSPPAPNKPISGKAGELTGSEGGALLTITDNELVNNSFATPGAEGCGGIFSFLIDPIVDSKLGLPSAAGHNTAILKGTLLTALSSAVKASE
jgi:hypothetical protein